MNFRQLAAASRNEVSVYVNRFYGGPSATGLIQLITGFAGIEETCKALQTILEDIEEDFGEEHFFAGYTPQHLPEDSYGKIHRNRVRLWFSDNKPWTHQVYLPEHVISCHMGRTFNKWGIHEEAQIIGKVTVANWSFDSRRALIIKVLLVMYHNNCCKFCDALMPQLEEDVCSQCWTRIGTPCAICRGEVGVMKFARMKRGLPKVFFHKGCAKRQRTQ